MNELNYVIFDCEEIFKVNFNEVKETSFDTLRKSLDGTKTFVKFDGEIPPSIVHILTKTKSFTHSEIIDIMSTPEWSKKIEEYDALKP
jgi:hypothetical protein